MLHGIFEFAELLKQFVLTGCITVFSVSVLLILARIFDFEDWPVHAAVATLVVLTIVFPHGWQALLGSGQENIDWDSLRAGIPYISPGSRFKVDLAAALIGASITYGLFYGLGRRKRW